MLKTEFGRKLMKKAIEIVRGTEWESVLWDEPKTPDEIKALRQAQAALRGTAYDYWTAPKGAR